MVKMDERDVFFFDIDNCLYSKNYNIHFYMAKLIDTYFQKRLNLHSEAASLLHAKYYKEYGLALEGLLRHHEIDPLEYNSEVDDALPLDKIIKPDPKLREFLLRIDSSKVKLWLFTNAYKNHALRVVRILGVEDLFEGLTYCDYSEKVLLCKPQHEMFQKAMNEAGIQDVKKCHFIDDSYINVKSAKLFGWKTTIQLVEPPEIPSKIIAGSDQVNSIYEVENILPLFFKK